MLQRVLDYSKVTQKRWVYDSHASFLALFSLIDYEEVSASTIRSKCQQSHE